MKAGDVLVFVLIAAISFGGLYLLVSHDDLAASALTSRFTRCQADHPDWSPAVCQGVAERRFGEFDVLAHPLWDWDTIGSSRIRVGMSKDMVKAAWGEPDYVSESGFLGFEEEWACGGHLLQFEDDLLSQISDAQIWSVRNILSIAERNAVDFENRASGRRVFVVGWIGSIDSNYDGSPRVRFEDPDYWDEVVCEFSPVFRDEVGDLRKGQFVVIVGTGAGIDFLGPSFVSCRIFSLHR